MTKGKRGCEIENRIVKWINFIEHWKLNVTAKKNLVHQ